METNIICTIGAAAFSAIATHNIFVGLAVFMALVAIMATIEKR